jgi:isopentenyldiphosphate isomerase
MDARWVERTALEEAARVAPWAFSPWMVEQLVQLAALPTTPLPREPATARAS